MGDMQWGQLQRWHPGLCLSCPELPTQGTEMPVQQETGTWQRLQGCSVVLEKEPLPEVNAGVGPTVAGQQRARSRPWAQAEEC